MKIFSGTILLIAFLLDYSLMPQLFFGYPGHLFLLAALVSLALWEKFQISLIWFLLAGFFWDYFSVYPQGCFLAGAFLLWLIIFGAKLKVIPEQLGLIAKIIFFVLIFIFFRVILYLLLNLTCHWLDRECSFHFFSGGGRLVAWWLFFIGAACLFYQLWARALKVFQRKEQDKIIV